MTNTGPGILCKVSLVSNPTPDVTTYSWSPPGVNALTRENKLSSLPFWAPNDKMKRHQFRLVLLKGLVPAADQTEDALGLLLELIPPPDDAGAAYPRGCVATVSLVPREQPDAAGAALELACTKKNMAVLDAQNLQISFPELVPARYVRDTRYVSPETGALTFQVQLQTGANIVAEQVAAPLSSLWGAISSTLSSLVQQTERVVHDVRVEFAQGTGANSGTATTTAGAAAASGEAAQTPWSTVPKAWEGREEAWRDLVRVHLGEDEGVALYGPERAMTLAEKNALVQAGVNPAVLLDLQRLFDYDRDVQEGLLESPTLNHMRYLLVPRRMKDEVFWANYFWKVACLAQCTNSEQVHTVLTILNAPPAEAPRAPSHVASALSAEEVASCVRDAQDAIALLTEYLAEGPSAEDALLVDTAAETCRGHLKQLDPLFRRTDLSEPQQQTIGAALRGLRAALQKHDELARAPVPAPVPATTLPQEAPAKEQEAPAPAPSTPPRPPVPADTSASVTPSAAAATPVVGASPLPTTPAPRAPAPPAPTASASASKARSQSGTSQLEFPKMPWEEEEDDGDV